MYVLKGVTRLWNTKIPALELLNIFVKILTTDLYPLSFEQVNQGKHFDPNLVEIFLNHIDVFLDIKKGYAYE